MLALRAGVLRREGYGPRESPHRDDSSAADRGRARSEFGFPRGYVPRDS